MKGILCALLAGLLLGLPLQGTAQGVAPTDAVKKGFEKAQKLHQMATEARRAGNDERALVLCEEACVILNGIKGKHPEWNKTAVKEELGKVLKMDKELEDTTTQSLEKIKEGRFRYLVWQRQVRIIRRLDRIIEKLDLIEKEIEETDDHVRDIKDRVGG